MKILSRLLVLGLAAAALVSSPASAAVDTFIRFEENATATGS